MQCLVFPGQGVQRRGMGQGLFEQHEDLVEQASQVLGYSITELCLHDTGARLRDTTYAQPAIFFVNALLGMQRMADEEYQFFAGHSLGEYNALVAAGSLDLIDGLALVAQRARAMGEIHGGGMAAVIGIDGELVTQTLIMSGLAGVQVANRNADQQTVIAGERSQLTLAATVLKQAGAKAVSILKVSGPFHTSLMSPAARAFAPVVGAVTFTEPTGTVMSTVTASPFAWQKAADLLCRQIDSPVEWVATVRALRAAGVTRFDEANGTTLTTLIRGIH